MTGTFARSLSSCMIVSTSMPLRRGICRSNSITAISSPYFFIFSMASIPSDAYSNSYELWSILPRINRLTSSSSTISVYFLTFSISCPFIMGPTGAAASSASSLVTEPSPFSSCFSSYISSSARANTLWK